MNDDRTTSLNGYVARNGTGKLTFFTEKPIRHPESLLSDEELEEIGTCRVHRPRQWERNWKIGGCKEIPFVKLPLDDSIFDDLKWEDEPVEVILSLTIKD